MPAVQRSGDANTAGGVAQASVTSVKVNGRAVIITGDSVTSHPCCGARRCPPIHCWATTSGGSPTVRAGGQPIVRTNDVDTCGHARAGGSDNVKVQ